ncbi:psmB6 [Symbiodinium pilosum]|uniref:Proteasome subunit beta n=1 Tax=Symbiodinium pilosum TaxID=2952 RepID=A0A812XMM5_SYMPI|nr:psmB6 [Symbiodinium pilosum]
MDFLAPRSAQEQMVRHVEEGCPYRADDVMAPEQAVSTGTTIMAVEFDGGVVMGADSRTSTGQYVANRASRKISKVHDKIFVCRCGSAADTQALTGFVVNYLGQHAVELGKQPTVNTAANLFKMIAYNNKDNLLAGLIVAGYDDKRGGQVYSIPLGGSRIRVPWACDGSGSGYIKGFIDSHYRPGMSKAECLEFVQKALCFAMSRDGSSGGVVRTLVITKDKVEESMIEGNKLPFGP